MITIDPLDLQAAQDRDRAGHRAADAEGPRPAAHP
jgi:hypothetical protein